jgi:hypothetical protein
MSEGIDYAEITDGKKYSQWSDSVYDNRIFSADAEARLLITEFESIRNFTKIKPSPRIIGVLDSLEYPKNSYQLLNHLPDMGDEYSLMFPMMIKYSNPDTIHKFIIQSICELIILIHDSILTPDTALNQKDQQSVKTFPSKLAINEMNYILHNQRLLSKPVNFSWRMLEVEDDTIPDQVGDVGEDVMNEIVETENEEAPYDPFSGEGMDYDTSDSNPNNEPD